MRKKNQRRRVVRDRNIDVISLSSEIRSMVDNSIDQKTLQWKALGDIGFGYDLLNVVKLQIVSDLCDHTLSVMNDIINSKMSASVASEIIASHLKVKQLSQDMIKNEMRNVTK